MKAVLFAVAFYIFSPTVFSPTVQAQQNRPPLPDSPGGALDRDNNNNRGFNNNNNGDGGMNPGLNSRVNFYNKGCPFEQKDGDLASALNSLSSALNNRIKNNNCSAAIDDFSVSTAEFVSKHFQMDEGGGSSYEPTCQDDYQSTYVAEYQDSVEFYLSGNGLESDYAQCNNINTAIDPTNSYPTPTPIPTSVSPQIKSCMDAILAQKIRVKARNCQNQKKQQRELSTATALGQAATAIQKILNDPNCTDEALVNTALAAGTKIAGSYAASTTGGLLGTGVSFITDMISSVVKKARNAKYLKDFKAVRADQDFPDSACLFYSLEQKMPFASCEKTTAEKKIKELNDEMQNASCGATVKISPQADALKSLMSSLNELGTAGSSEEDLKKNYTALSQDLKLSDSAKQIGRKGAYETKLSKDMEVFLSALSTDKPPTADVKPPSLKLAVDQLKRDSEEYHKDSDRSPPLYDSVPSWITDVMYFRNAKDQGHTSPEFSEIIQLEDNLACQEAFKKDLKEKTKQLSSIDEKNGRDLNVKMDAFNGAQDLYQNAFQHQLDAKINALKSLKDFITNEGEVASALDGILSLCMDTASIFQVDLRGKGKEMRIQSPPSECKKFMCDGGIPPFGGDKKDFKDYQCNLINQRPQAAKRLANQFMKEKTICGKSLEAL